MYYSHRKFSAVEEEMLASILFANYRFPNASHSCLPSSDSHCISALTASQEGKGMEGEEWREERNEETQKAKREMQAHLQLFVRLPSICKQHKNGIEERSMTDRLLSNSSYPKGK